MTNQKFKIVYSFNPELEPEKFKETDKLDKVLTKVANDLGFKLEGSGYNFKTCERVLEFIKE